jgi:hypothetical protein
MLRMQVTAIAILLISASYAHAYDWSEVQGASYSFDRSSIKRNATDYSVWLKYSLPQYNVTIFEINEPRYEKYAYSLLQSRINCAERTLAFTKVYDYGSDNLVIQTLDASDPAEVPPSNSFGEKLVDQICNFIKKNPDQIK